MEAPPLRIDVHEPLQAQPLLAPIVPCQVESLNDKGYADYLWAGVVGEQQAERKTWFEILSGMDSVEDQLRRERQAHPKVRLMLIIEGVATPAMVGSEVFNETTKGKRHLFYSGKSFALPMQAVYAWLYQVEKYMEVYFTPNYVSTLKMLVAFYKADQKGEHSTFQRYLKDMDFHPNPMVQRLMGLGGNLGIGPTRALALIERFGTSWNVISASPQELASVDGIGLKTAQQFLRGVGRPDV